VASSSESSAVPLDVEQARQARDQAELELRKAEARLREATAGTAESVDGASELNNYGYTRRSAGEYFDIDSVGVPGSVFEMGAENFIRESRAIADTLDIRVPAWVPDIQYGGTGVSDKQAEEAGNLRAKLLQLTLSNEAIWERERARPEIEAPWIIKGPYFVLCYILDVAFDKRPLSRFWFLETVARMPYFSYSTMLYSYELLGWWRRGSELRKVHFAEEWNEFHHLLIMESLGGDQSWYVRFVGQHSALVYYLVLVLLWLLSPTLAYNFSELIEAHAVDTYAQFLDENEELLKSLPPPRVARVYYQNEDLYMFDEFQTEQKKRATRRRPPVASLYDVFANIRDDEGEHVATMRAVQDDTILARSPNVEAYTAVFFGFLVATQVAISQYTTGEDIELVEGPVRTILEALSEADGIIDFITLILPFL